VVTVSVSWLGGLAGVLVGVVSVVLGVDGEELDGGLLGASTGAGGLLTQAVAVASTVVRLSRASRLGRRIRGGVGGTSGEARSRPLR